MLLSPRRLVTGAVGVALLAFALQAAPARAAGNPPPPHAPVPARGTGALLGFESELNNPTGEPPGVANRPCTPAATHPYPVVLVHGTFANENFSWQTLAPMLADAGYCVFGFNYGATSWTAGSGNHSYAVDLIERSSAQLATFITKVALADTVEHDGKHLTQVDLVGHSQGGMMPRYLIDRTGNRTYPGLGDAALVHTMIGLAPSNHGTTLDGLVTLFSLFGNAPYTFPAQLDCGSCGEQEAGSPFLQALNAHADATGPDYYVIESDKDEVVTPYTSAFLPHDRNVVNVTLQAQCPTDFTEHLGIIYDPVALADVMHALANNSPHVSPLPAPSCPPVVLPGLSG